MSDSTKIKTRRKVVDLVIDFMKKNDYCLSYQDKDGNDYTMYAYKAPNNKKLYIIYYFEPGEFETPIATIYIDYNKKKIILEHKYYGYKGFDYNSLDDVILYLFRVLRVGLVYTTKKYNHNNHIVFLDINYRMDVNDSYTKFINFIQKCKKDVIKEFCDMKIFYPYEPLCYEETMPYISYR